MSSVKFFWFIWWLITMTKWSTSVARDVMSSCWRGYDLRCVCIYVFSRLYSTFIHDWWLPRLVLAVQSARRVYLPPYRCISGSILILRRATFSVSLWHLHRPLANLLPFWSSPYSMWQRIIHDLALRYLLIVDLLSWPGARSIKLNKQCEHCANEMSSLHSVFSHCSFTQSDNLCESARRVWLKWLLMNSIVNSELYV